MTPAAICLSAAKAPRKRARIQAGCRPRLRRDRSARPRAPSARCRARARTAPSRRCSRCSISACAPARPAPPRRRSRPRLRSRDDALRRVFEIDAHEVAEFAAHRVEQVADDRCIDRIRSRPPARAALGAAARQRRRVPTAGAGGSANAALDDVRASPAAAPAEAEPFLQQLRQRARDRAAWRCSRPCRPRGSARGRRPSRSRSSRRSAGAPSPASRSRSRHRRVAV